MEDLQQFGTEVGSAVTTSSVTECALTCQAIEQCNFWRQALAEPNDIFSSNCIYLLSTQLKRTSRSDIYVKKENRKDLISCWVVAILSLRWHTQEFSGSGWESPLECYIMSDQTGSQFSSPNTISGSRDCLPGVTSTSSSSSTEATTGGGRCESYDLQIQARL